MDEKKRTREELGKVIRERFGDSVLRIEEGRDGYRIPDEALYYEVRAADYLRAALVSPLLGETYRTRERATDALILAYSVLFPDLLP